MSKGKHRKRSTRHRGAVIAAAGVIGAGASMLATASPASAATATGTGTVSDVTIASAAANAGLAGCRGVPLSTWVAVALGESGGNTFAHATVGEDSRGLWQINMRAHAGWAGSRNLYDPATNAWAAKQVCDSQGVMAWSAYTYGRYSRFLGRGQAAAAAAAVASPTPRPRIRHLPAVWATGRTYGRFSRSWPTSVTRSASTASSVTRRTTWSRTTSSSMVCWWTAWSGPRHGPASASDRSLAVRRRRVEFRSTRRRRRLGAPDGRRIVTIHRIPQDAIS